MTMANWKTTLAGFVAGGLYIFAQSFKPGMSWHDWAAAGGIALVGILAKDFNVTGGTTANK